MKDNEYLYGEGVEVPEIPADVIARRVELLKDHLHEIMEHSFYTRDVARMNAIVKAIDFWEKLN